MINDIDKQIAELDIPALKASLELGGITPRDYQWLTYKLSGDEIRKYSGPFIVTASVGAGKTIMMAMLAKRFQDMGMKGILLARQAELIEQDAEALWQCGAKNSIFSAGLGMKSVAYPVVAGTEKSVYNALYEQLGDFTPSFLLLDECLAGESLIETRNGLYRIDDPDLKNQEIKCISERDCSIQWNKPNRVFNNGIKDVSSIKLKSGKVITCTGTHKLLSRGSWVRSHSLNAGDELTLSGSGDSFTRKLLRAVAAVAKELFQ